MAIVTSAGLVDVLRQHKLLEPVQLDEVSKTLVTKFADPRALAREILQLGWLSPFQVNQIFLGKAADLVLGSYVIMERLGEGGMGQVLKARHSKLGRIVALKVIRQDRLNSPEALYRFRREIQAAGQLSHPNVVHSYDADQIGDRHLIVMEFVDGIDLGRLVKKNGPLPIPVACEYIRQACQGLQHAFEHNLVHRDIKPSNLLLMDANAHGSQPGGLVKMLDLGLARVIKEGDDGASMMLTQAGALVGTPDFISPEQARNAHVADIRSDLYSLGCTLFYLLTGQAPFQGGSITEKLLKHHWDAPPAVEGLRPDVPPILSGLLRKLMAKNPEDRFQTPTELAEFLGRLLQPGGFDMPVPAEWAAADQLPPAPALPVAANTMIDTDLPQALVATPVSHSATEEMPAQALPVAMPVRRSRWIPVAGIAGLLTMLAAMGLLVKMLVNTSDARVKANTGRLLTTNADAPSPLDKLNKERVPSAERLPVLAKELVAVLGEQRGRHYGSIQGVAISPDGQTVASAGQDGFVRLWDAGTLQPRSALRRGTAELTALAYSPNGKTLAAGDAKGNVFLWDASRSPPVEGLVLKHPDAGVAALAFTPEGQGLAVALTSGELQMWEWAGKVDPRKGALLRGHEGAITALTIAPGGKMLATGSEDKMVRVWEMTGPQPRFRPFVIPGHNGPVTAVVFDPNVQMLVSGSSDGTLRFWNLTFPKPAPRLPPFDVGADVGALVFGDGQTLYCGLDDTSIRVFDLSGGQQPRQRARLQDTTPVRALALSTKGKLLASGSAGGLVRLWDVGEGPPREHLTPKGHTAAITSLMFAGDGHQLVSGSEDQTVRIWDMNGSEPTERSVFERQGPVASVAFSPDGKHIAAASKEDAAVRLWDLPATQPRTWMLDNPEETRGGCVGFLDNQTLATGGWDGAKGLLKLWDIKLSEPTLLHAFKGPPTAVTSLACSGTQLLAAVNGGDHHELHLWDRQSRREQHVMHATPRGKMGAVGISPEGRFLAVGHGEEGNTKNQGPDFQIWIWDLKANPAKQLSGILLGGNGTVRGLAFSPDGTRLVSADDQGRLLLADPESGKPVQEWRLPGAINAVAYAPDGRHLAVGSANGTIYILRLKTVPAR